MPSRIPSAWLCLAYTLLLMLFLLIQPAGSLPGRALYQTLSYALLLYMFHRHTRDIQRKEDKPKGKPLSTILLTLFLLIIVPAISWLLLKLAYTLIPMPDSWKALFAANSSALMGEPVWLKLIAMALIPALAEELLFRGAFLRSMLPRYNSPKALLISSLLFGLAHLNPWHFLPAFGAGLLLGWLTIKTGRLSPAILVHLGNNALWLLLAPRIMPAS